MQYVQVHSSSALTTKNQQSAFKIHTLEEKQMIELLSFDSAFYNCSSSWNVTGYQACDQQYITNSSTLPLRWSHFVQSSPATLQTLWFGYRVRPGCLTTAFRMPQQREKYSSRKACFSPSSSFFSTSSGRRKLHLESSGKAFQAQQAMREIQIYQMPVWQLLSWAVLKRNYLLKAFPRPVSRYYFAHASPSPLHQGDLHLAWLCEKYWKD